MALMDRSSSTLRPCDGEVPHIEITPFTHSKYRNAKAPDLTPVIIQVRDKQTDSTHRLVQQDLCIIGLRRKQYHRFMQIVFG